MQNSATGKFLPRTTFQIPRETGMIMKLLTVFILVASMQVHARINAQTVTWSAKNVTIDEAFKEINRQTKIGFMYSSEILKTAKRVSIDANKKDIKEVLEAMFKDQPFTYELKGTTVVVKDKVVDGSKKDVTTELVAPPPGIDVHGRVTDSAGNPLAGASVKVKGVFGKGTITDDNGEFTIKGVTDNSRLTVEFIGYKTSEFLVGNRTEIIAILHIADKQLAEVAIQSYSTGYQQVSRNRTPGSVVFMNNELVNRRVSPDIISRLEGVASGVLFTRNTTTAGGAEISIRGRSTLFANANPLIVVDNFPYDGNINNINPNDIESITILKDASAASIWGAQSGNGVIVLTTKKGKRNRPLAVELNSNVTIMERPNIYYSRQFIPSADFISVEQNLFAQGFYDNILTNPTSHSAVSPVVQLLADQRAGLVTPDVVNAQINKYKQYDIRNDISKYFYQKAVQQQYAVNINGGSDKTDYYLSFGFDKDLGNQTRNKNQRITFNSYNNFYLLKNWVVSANLLYSQGSSDANSTLGEFNTGGNYSGSIYPYAQFADAAGAPLAVPKLYNTSWVLSTGQVGRQNWLYYPLKELNWADNRSNFVDNRLALSTKYSFLKGLSFNLKYSYEKYRTQSSEYHSDSTFFSRDLFNKYFNSSTNQSPVPLGGILSQSESERTSNRLRAQLDYAKSISVEHSINAIIGAEITDIKDKSFLPNWLFGYNSNIGNASNVDFRNTYITYPAGTFSSIPGSGSTQTNVNRFISYFGNVIYGFKEIYSIAVSARIDKSNLFGVTTNQKSVPLYSIGGGVELSKEKFYHLDWLPFLKFRATYGYNGNINNGVTGVPTIAYGSTGYFYPTPYAGIQSNGNPLLRWEKIRIMNFALDFSSKNNFASGTVEYYNKKGSDIFGTTPLAPSTGSSSFLGNTANIQGSGWDITLNLRPIKTNIFSWNSAILFSNERSVVSKYLAQSIPSALLSAGADGATISPFEGKPVFSIYSYRSGPLNAQGDPQGYLNGKLSTDYAAVIAATTLDSLSFNGSARPTIYGSWRNTFSYKRFAFSFNVGYKFNYYFRRSSIGYSGLFNNWSVNRDFLIRWQKPGDEASTIVPSMPTTISQINSNRDYFYNFSDKLVDKGDQIRLQDITLSYEFSSHKLAKAGIKTIKVYSYINNIGIIWRANKDGIDPDVYSGGLPLPRSYAVGVQMSF